MPLSQEDKEILSSQSESKTSAQWVEFFDHRYTKKQIWDYCSHHKLKIGHITGEEFSKLQSQRARKYHINQDYFKTWSRNMADVLGLWFADGCIYRGQMFDITLHNKDRYIYQKVNNKPCLIRK